MLAYEKGAIKQVPRRGGVDALLSTSSCWFFKLQIPNTAEDPVVSVYTLLCSTITSCSVHYVVLLEKKSIHHPCSALFLYCRCTHWLPTKLGILFGISSLFPWFFSRWGRVGEGENLDFVAESGKCYQRVGGEGFLCCCIFRKSHIHRELHGVVEENSWRGRSSL